MKFTTGRVVEYSDYAAQDFDSIVDGPVTLLYGEKDIGTVALSVNRFADATNWAANDLESLPLGTTPDISSAGTNNGGDTTLNIPSRFV